MAISEGILSFEPDRSLVSELFKLRLIETFYENAILPFPRRKILSYTKIAQQLQALIY